MSGCYRVFRMMTRTYRSLVSMGGSIPRIRHGRRMPGYPLRGGGSIAPTWGRSDSTATKNLLLAASLLLLEGSRSRFDQGALDTASDVRRKDWPCIQRPRDRLFPRFQHLIQFPARLRVDQGVGVHEGLVHVPAQEQRVGSPYIFDDRVDYIQSREFLRRRCLHHTH